MCSAQDPSKPCVKNHHSLVLRADSASEKFMWLARLKNASDGGGAGGRAPLRGYTSEQLRADSVTSSTAPTPRDGVRRGGVRPVPLSLSSSVAFAQKLGSVMAVLEFLTSVRELQKSKVSIETMLTNL